MKLFDDMERAVPRPASPGEDSFAFMNRVHSPYWERARRLLDEWFTQYPVSHAADLRARFRSADLRQHLAAWWELYLFILIRRLGFDVEVHPDIEGSDAHPDFRAVRGADAFYLEAVAVFSGIVEEGRHGAREAWILDLINEAKNPDFFVGVDFEKVGAQRPSRVEVIRPIEEGLQTLDPDAPEHSDELPSRDLRFREWVVALEAFPVKPEARGKGDHRLLGRGPISGGYVNDVEKLQAALRRKRGRYGQLNDPYAVAALLTSGFFQPRDVEQALFGREAVVLSAGPEDARLVRQRNGVWMSGRGPRARSVSAVITATELQPWTVARVLPRLWRNPWAISEFTFALPLPTASGDEEGRVEYQDGTTTAGDLFELPPEWPGPDPPFT